MSQLSEHNIQHYIKLLKATVLLILLASKQSAVMYCQIIITPNEFLQQAAYVLLIIAEYKKQITS